MTDGAGRRRRKARAGWPEGPWTGSGGGGGGGGGGRIVTAEDVVRHAKEELTAARGQAQGPSAGAAGGPAAQGRRQRPKPRERRGNAGERVIRPQPWEALCFTESDVPTACVTLQNLRDREHVAFKFKATQPAAYHVTTPVGVLAPGEHFKVFVHLNVGHEGHQVLREHAFLLVSAVVPDASAPSAEGWAAMERKHEHRFRVLSARDLYAEDPPSTPSK